MTDFFSISKRQFLVYKQYLSLFLEQRTKTLIGSYLSCLSTKIIEKRIMELTKLEKEQGFVFIGENLWLQQYLKDKKFIRYDQWVSFVFKSLGIMFSYTEYSEQEGFPEKVWSSAISSQFIMTDLLTLADNYYVSGDLELSVFGTHSTPSLCHLVKLYEFLFCFEYIISQLPNIKESETSIEITGISVTHPSSVNAWEIEFMSEYGAVWDQPALGMELRG